MTKNYRYLIPVLALLAISCRNDDDSSDDVVVNEPDYIVSLRTQASSEETADYLVTSDDLMSGEITAEGQGTELLGWNFGGIFGGTYFSYTTQTDECYAYNTNSGSLPLQGRYLSSTSPDVLLPIDDNYFMAISAPWGGGSYDCTFDIVDINGVSVASSNTDPVYVSYDGNGVQMNAWPTGGYVEGDKLFVTFYPLNGTTWETPNTDTAYVSIFSFPELEYISTSKNANTSPIGYYAGQPCVIEDDFGDHYFLSSSSLLAGYTQMTKPSGVTKIASGSDSFDENYFFDVEALGYKVLSGVYAGNGKVVARVSSVSNEIPDYSWGAFSVTTPALFVAVIDVHNQTFNLVSDVPVHGGQYQTPYLVENNSVYISVNDGTDAYVYRVNPSSATAERGAKIIGNELQAIAAN